MLRTTKMNLLTVCLAVIVAGVVGHHVAADDTTTKGAVVLPTPQVVLPTLEVVSPPPVVLPSPQVILPSPPVVLPPGWVSRQLHPQLPILVPGSFPMGPPSWMLKRLPLVPAPWVSLPIDQALSPVDPGSLKTDERVVPDSAGGHYLVRERTWTSNGVPCREIIETHLLESLPVPAATPTLPKTDQRAQPLPQPVPDTNEQVKVLPQPVPDTDGQGEVLPQPVPDTTARRAPKPAAPKPAAVESPEPSVGEPAEDAARGKLNLVEVEPPALVTAEEQPQPTVGAEEPSTAGVQEPGTMVGIGVSVDSEKGTRIYEYYQGGADQPVEKRTERRIESRIESVPGRATGIGVGVSVDPKHGTRVYRYYHGEGTGARILSQ